MKEFFNRVTAYLEECGENTRAAVYSILMGMIVLGVSIGVPVISLVPAWIVICIYLLVFTVYYGMPPLLKRLNSDNGVGDDIHVMNSIRECEESYKVMCERLTGPGGKFMAYEFMMNTVAAFSLIVIGGMAFTGFSLMSIYGTLLYVKTRCHKE